MYVLIIKFEDVFSSEKNQWKKKWKNGGKYWKSQGILSGQKSGNHVQAGIGGAQNHGLSHIRRMFDRLSNSV